MKLLDKESIKLRLQVFLSRNGVCSRRRAFEIIQEGRVMVNGKICREPSTAVDPNNDQVSVDAKKIHGKNFEYIMLNKPAGYMTTKSDRFAQKTIISLLPKKYHYLSPVGRLDKNTEGLLLLTNDGDLAYRLTHPKFNVDKTYFVRILGRLEHNNISKLKKGIIIDGKKTLPARINNIKNLKDKTELTIVIHEGRKRQIRYMFDKVGHKVIYLKRLIQGPISLGPLKKGMWRALKSQEIDKVKKI